MKISDLFEKSQIITFTGLAKNVGKTTTMRKVLQELAYNNKRCGVTCSGRNGEPFDVLNRNISKPQIDFPAGSLLATTDHLLAKSNAPVRRLESTPYRTPLGRVVIAEVLQAGKFEVAGPSTSSGLKAVAQQMLALGAQYVLIDGAINRKAAASPHVSDSVVLSTGAILSPDLEFVVQETSRQVDLFLLPQVEELTVIEIFQKIKGVSLVDQDYKITPLVTPSTLNTGKISAQVIQKNTAWLLIPTSVSDSMLEPIAQLKRKNRLTVVVSDATKVFISPDKLDFYREHGIDLRVIHPVNLLCITANPTSPDAHQFDPRSFIRELHQALPNIPIMDVVSELALF